MTESVRSPSPLADAPDVSPKTLRRAILASAVGNFVEWYDNGLYAMFAVVIAANFFSSSSPTTALIATFSGYALSYAVRPLGAIVLGRLVDIRGRRWVLAFTILSMSAGTALIGILPTEAEIGVLAPILLFALRGLQGFSAGGEWTTAMSYLLEHAGPEKRNRLSSFNLVGNKAGLLVSVLLGAGLSGFLSQDDFYSWGWRLPFLLAIPFGAVGFYIRSSVTESPEFAVALATQKAGAVRKRPVTTALRTQWRGMLIVVGLFAGDRVASFTLTAFAVTALISSGVGETRAFLATAIVFALYIPLVVLSGKVADAWGSRKTLLRGYGLLFVTSLPAMWLLSQGSLLASVAGLIIVLVSVIALAPSTSRVAVTMFPVSVRGTASAISYNIVTLLFGATTPIIGSAILGSSDSLVNFGYYTMAVAAVSFIVILLARNLTRDASMTGDV